MASSQKILQVLHLQRQLRRSRSQQGQPESVRIVGRQATSKPTKSITVPFMYLQRNQEADQSAPKGAKTTISPPSLNLPRKMEAENPRATSPKLWSKSLKWSPTKSKMTANRNQRSILTQLSGLKRFTSHWNPRRKTDRAQ